MDAMGAIFDALEAAGFRPIRQRQPQDEIWLNEPRLVIRDTRDLFDVTDGFKHRTCNGPDDVVAAVRQWSTLR